jgi:pectate lyase
VVHELQQKINVSLSRRELLGKEQGSCLTGNPVDDCWRCDTNWAENRQKLAECGIGFGRAAMGGKNGQIYIVTDSSDKDPANPIPGTLRHAVIQDEPLWIIFAADMTINLRHELIFNSFKTVTAVAQMFKSPVTVASHYNTSQI